MSQKTKSSNLWDRINDKEHTHAKFNDKEHSNAEINDKKLDNETSIQIMICLNLILIPM